MGCCESLFLRETHPEKVQAQQAHHTQAMHPPPTVGIDSLTGEASTFSEFSFSDLKAATNNFSSEFIVSESGEKAPNLVYKGRLQNRRWIAVKKFTKMAWPDPKQFAVRFLFCLFTFFFCLFKFAGFQFLMWVLYKNFCGFYFLGGGERCGQVKASEAC